MMTHGIETKTIHPKTIPFIYFGTRYQKRTKPILRSSGSYLTSESLKLILLVMSTPNVLTYIFRTAKQVSLTKGHMHFSVHQKALDSVPKCSIRKIRRSG